MKGPLFLVAAVVIGMWVAYILIVLTSSQSMATLGTFGDAFGALNTLFSGLAFAVLIYTVHLQKQELELQRKEMADTREELRGQKEQLAKQNELSVLAARLSILPRLIEQEFVAIGKVHSRLEDWHQWAPTAKQAEELSVRMERDAEMYAAKVATNEQAIKDNRDQASGEVAAMRDHTHRLKNEQQKCMGAAARLKNLSALLSDAETIYLTLRGR